MKKLLMLLMLVMLVFVTGAMAQVKDNKGNLLVGYWNDTVKSNTTLRQKINIGTQSGITISYRLTQVTDTITGVASVWCSIDDTTWVKHPTLDSITISAATNAQHIWYVNTKANGLAVRQFEVRTRCPSNTTNSTSKARVRTKVFQY